MQQLSQTHNLLAFSGGVDSTALFFKLLSSNIKFDIAIVDYNQRQQSKKEVAYAKYLAKTYNKKCFIKEFGKDDKFSEKIARDFRYNFFEDIIKQDNYDVLLTAHQLNDKFEWFLMQLSKGAGLNELLGLQEQEQRDGYILVRPLLDYTKQELQDELESKDIKYFIDQSNFDKKYKRNDIRANFSNNFINQYSNGVKKSFIYLQKDVKSLFSNTKSFIEKELSIYEFNRDENIAIRLIDQDLKKRGILISKNTRDEILKQKEIIIQDKIAVSIIDNKIYIAPKIDITMDKKFKEKARVKKIPKNIRPYLFKIDYKI